MDAPVGGERLLFDNFRLEPMAGRLFRRDATGEWEPVPIGARALDILGVLLKAPGVVVSRDAIMDAVWPGIAVEPSNLTVQIAALRRVLDEGRVGDSCIQTVPGRGYRFDLGATRAVKASFSPSPEPGTEPVAVPEARAPRRGPLRRRLIATTGVVAIIALLLGAVWHGDWLPGARSPHRLSLVVLPFVNLSGYPGDSYLADGITGDLTTALSHIPGAFVIAQATAYTYRGKAEDIRKIGRDLDVRYVVRGSIQRLGQLLKVNAELGSAETGAQLWSDSFDQKVEDLAAGQDQIVIRMRSALDISLAEIEAARSLRERPTNPEAFDLILQARAIALLPRTKETVTKKLGLFEQALARDPNSVIALAGATVAVADAYYVDAMPYESVMPRALQYVKRAQNLAPNSEAVLVAQSYVLDLQTTELDYRRVLPEYNAVGQKLIDLYPNNSMGYFRLAVLARIENRFDDGTEYFAKTIHLNPRSPDIKTLYWNMAYCTVYAGRDREGLEWADRAIGAEGDLRWWRLRNLNVLRAVAYARTGNLEAATRIVKEMNDRFPVITWRGQSPYDPDSEKNRKQVRSFMEALRAAGMRDDLDPNTDFGILPDDSLHLEFEGKTPTTAPGVTTVGTEELAGMLRDKKPLVIDTMAATWYRSVPGAVGLDFNGNTHGTFTDVVQKRLEQKLRQLTGGDMTKPIVALGWSVGSFDGYNLALRIRHAGYTNVYWYRGGRQSWEVAGKPEDVVRPADW